MIHPILPVREESPLWPRAFQAQNKLPWAMLLRILFSTKTDDLVQIENDFDLLATLKRCSSRMSHSNGCE